MGRLEGRAAVVTGGTGTLGSRIAVALAREGARVIVHHHGDQAAASDVVAEIEGQGGQARAVAGDPARAADASAIVAAATEAFGHLDILVNTPPAMPSGLVLRLGEDDWRAAVATGLDGAFHCTRAALREFVRQRRGRIINVTSTSGQGGAGSQTTYVAARAGVIGLTRAVAREVGSRGITVNAVAPGFIDAGTGQSAASSAPESLLAQVPLGRAGTPEDVAAAVVFLASEEASYITGQVLNVDGGMVMH